MFEFTTQCCDAHQYLDFGRVCVTTGECYNTLRPLGAVLWFAWPKWLGLPDDSLIAAHLALLVLSVVLSVFALRRWLYMGGYGTGLPLSLLLLVLSAGSHVFFFWPVLFVALADAPAGLLGLIGLWLLFLGWQRGTGLSLLLLGMSGLLLGLAVWIRAFYLYPLFVLLALYLLLWVLRPSRRWVEWMLVLALLPVGTQYAMTWQRYQQFSFIAPSDSRQWSVAHLRDAAAGYDTVMPGDSYRWFPKCAFGVNGLKGAWERKDIAPAWCILSSRMAFYWFSDARMTYMNLGDQRNLLRYGESLDTYPIWINAKLDVIPDAAVSPDGRKTAERVQMRDGGHEAGVKELFTGLRASAAGMHTASLWLWSPLPKALQISWLQVETNRVLAEKTVVLTPEPVRYVLPADFQSMQEYNVFIIRAPAAQETDMGYLADDYYHAWGVQIEPGGEASDYAFAKTPSVYRHWSTSLGIIHLILVALVWSLWLHPGLRSVPFAMAFFLMALVFGEALLIVPEQRFIVVFQTLLWLFGGIALFLMGQRCWRSQLVVQDVDQAGNESVRP